MIPTKNPIPQKQPTTPPAPVVPTPEDEPDEPSGGGKWWIWVVLGLLAVGAILFFILRDSGDNSRKGEAETEEVAETEAQAIDSWDEEEPEEEIIEDDTPEEILAEEIINVNTYNDGYADPVKEAPAAEAPAELPSATFDRGTEVIIDEVKNSPSQPAPQRPTDDSNKVFTSVEQMPQFPGGEAALMQYIATHIKYPAIAMENNVQGRVVVQFVVQKDGSVGEVKIARGKDPDLDREAMRVVKTFPRFNPGKMNGVPVNVWYTIPINFKLQTN